MEDFSVVESISTMLWSLNLTTTSQILLNFIFSLLPFFSLSIIGSVGSPCLEEISI